MDVTETPPATLTVVVPATDDPGTLAECVAAIRASDAPPEELLVVETPKLCGPAHARNLAAAEAQGGLIAFVDSDVLVHPDAFTRIRDAFRRDPGLAAVFGSYDDRPRDARVVSQFRNLLHHHVHQTSGGPAQTFWAGLGAIRRDALEAVGGFDAERFPRSSVEDIELGMRLVAAGGRIELDPALQCTHLKGWPLGRMLRTDLRRRAVPWLRLMLDEGSASHTLNLGRRHRASALLSLAVASSAVLRRPRTAGAALLGLVALNHSFYALLLRRRGPVEAGAGIGLHVLHHLVAVAAVPVALVLQVTRAPAEERLDRLARLGRPRIVLREREPGARVSEPRRVA